MLCFRHIQSIYYSFLLRGGQINHLGVQGNHSPAN